MTSPGVNVKMSSVVVGGLNVEVELELVIESDSVDDVVMKSTDGSVVVSSSVTVEDGEVAIDELKVDLSSSAVVDVLVVSSVVVMSCVGSAVSTFSVLVVASLDSEVAAGVVGCDELSVVEPVDDCSSVEETNCGVILELA